MSTTAKVGLLFIAALLVGAVLVLRIEQIRLFRPRGEVFRVKVADVKGLEEKAAVRVAGVRVGTVTDLELAGKGVEVTVHLTRRVELREGAQAQIISRGMLGDKELELVAGPEDAAPLAPGSEIPEKVSVASLEEVVSLAGDIGRDVKAVTSGLKQVVGEPEGEQKLEAILENLTQLTERLNRLAERQGANLDSSLENAAAVSMSLKSAASNLESITRRLNEGEGTLGQLISSPETGDNLNEALTSVTALSSAAQRVTAFRVSLGMRAEYLFAHAKPKGYFSLELAPSEELFYRLEAVTQPLGLRSERTTVTTRGGDDTVAVLASAATTTTVREEQYTDGFAFSAMVGFRFKPLELRAGLLESKAGLGASVALLEGRLRLTADAWDFDREGHLPHAKLQGSVHLLPAVYLMAGWDDLLNRGRQADSFFLGAGVRLDPGG